MELSSLDIYRNKRVFITGNTGFKGSWLSIMLEYMGAAVYGYSLPPINEPAHFNLLKSSYPTDFADISDREILSDAVKKAKPEIIFHLAAQSLVRASYTDPVNTYQTNVIGTLNLLEAAKNCESVKAVVLITTDKVYENKESERPYTENDELGGYDMYSSSKACCEILIRSYRNSFLNIDEYKRSHTILIASARAGNVIGGGDWSADRLVPDTVRAASQRKSVQIRNPKAIRPWQHVLDCLYGYILLGGKLLNEQKEFAEAWNFSPDSKEAKNVEEIAAIAKQCWNDIDIEFGKPRDYYHEANLLILDNTKAKEKLDYSPLWNTTEAVQKTIEWYREFYKCGTILSKRQAEEFLSKANME